MIPGPGAQKYPSHLARGSDGHLVYEHIEQLLDDANRSPSDVGWLQLVEGDIIVEDRLS